MFAMATTFPSNSGPTENGAPKPMLLIVDDEDGPRQSLRILFKENYNILMASDGATAIELAKNNHIDVAILDIRMAGMSGIEVLERLKYVDPSIEVVMMTAFETTDTIRQALRLQACDYINKPFDVATMRGAVSKAMQRRTLENEINNNAEQRKRLLEELQNQKMAEQMSHTRGEIYASIIHDMNGPLTVISGFIQLMNQRIGDSTQLGSEDVQFIKERLKTITRQVTNCIEISRRYLSFLRRSSGETSLARVNELLGDLGHLIRVHPSLHHNQFVIESLPHNMGVQVNGTDVIQILFNLTVNAFQCVSIPHSVKVYAEALNAPIELAAFKDGPQDRFLNVENFDNTAPLVRLSVADDGPGIPQETLPKIFQPFFTTKGPTQGTGLGLNIVLRLVKEARGALHVHTEPGKGTTFNVYLAAFSVPQ
jgi:two-component system sensor histidine kinase/response regulator